MISFTSQEIMDFCDRGDAIRISIRSLKVELWGCSTEITDPLFVAIHAMETVIDELEHELGRVHRQEQAELAEAIEAEKALAEAATTIPTMVNGEPWCPRPHPDLKGWAR